MKREIINEKDLSNVVGGSIVFNADHTTCGYDRNDEYRVIDHDKAMAYMVSKITRMDERDILRKCVEKGYLEEI